MRASPLRRAVLLLVVLLVLLYTILLPAAGTSSDVVEAAAEALQRAISSAAGAPAVRQALAKLYQAHGKSDMDTSGFLWGAVLRGDAAAAKLVLRDAKKRAKRAKRRFDINRPSSQSGARGTLLHAACFAGNERMSKLLLASGANSLALDAQGLTSFDAVVAGWKHRFLNMHGTPTAAAAARQILGDRKSFAGTLIALVERTKPSDALTTRLARTATECARISFADCLSILLSQVSGIAAALPQDIVVDTLRETRSLVIRTSKWLVQHGNVAVDPDLLEAYPDSPRMDSFAFIGLSAATVSAVVTEDGFSYNRTALNDMLFSFHTEHVLGPLLRVGNTVGQFAAHEAAYVGNVQALHALLAWAKDNNSRMDLALEARNGRGWTALQCAAVGNHKAAHAVLLAAGADASVLLELQLGHFDPLKVQLEVSSYTPATLSAISVNQSNAGGAAAGGGGWRRASSPPQSRRTPTAAKDPTCDFDVMETWNPRVFESDYFYSNRPVLIRNQPDVRAWAAGDAWQRETFVHHHAQDMFSVFGAIDPPSPRARSFEMPLDAFMERLDSEEEPPFWLVETEFTSAKRRQQQQQQQQQQLFSEAVEAVTGRFRWYEQLLANAGRDGGEYSNYQFMISPEGVGAAPHFHNSALNALLHGRKTWFLFPPATAVHSTKSVLQWYQDDFVGGATVNRPLVCTQKAGDVMFVPDLWGHAVIADAPGASVGLAHLFSG